VGDADYSKIFLVMGQACPAKVGVSERSHSRSYGVSIENGAAS